MIGCPHIYRLPPCFALPRRVYKLESVNMYKRRRMNVTNVYGIFAAGVLSASLHTSPQFAEPTFSVGGLVRATSATVDTAGPLTSAVALWNLYYPLRDTASKSIGFEVTGASVVDYGIENVIGQATPNGTTWTLTVKASLHPQQMFDVFVHEVAHAVIPLSAPAPPNRVLDDGHHWSPYEDNEIFSPYITDTPFMATYTAAAAGSDNIACDTHCDNGLACTAVGPPYRSVPNICKASTGDTPTSPLIIIGLLIGFGCLILILILVTRRRVHPTTAKESTPSTVLLL